MVKQKFVKSVAKRWSGKQWNNWESAKHGTCHAGFPGRACFKHEIASLPLRIAAV